MDLLSTRIEQRNKMLCFILKGSSFISVSLTGCKKLFFVLNFKKLIMNDFKCSCFICNYKSINHGIIHLQGKEKVEVLVEQENASFKNEI